VRSRMNLWALCRTYGTVTPAGSCLCILSNVICDCRVGRDRRVTVAVCVAIIAGALVVRIEFIRHRVRVRVRVHFFARAYRVVTKAVATSLLSRVTDTQGTREAEAEGRESQ
jgi:hypothetical protein